MPLLIVFSLLLVLSNASHSVESYELTPPDEAHAVAAPRQTKNVITDASIDNGILMESYELNSAENDDEEEKGRDTAYVSVQHLKKIQPVATTKGFTCTDNNSCQNIICSGGPIYTLQVEFDYILNWCGNKYFDVIIEDCTFNKNTIDRSTFSGSFKISTLTIRNCTLDTIVDNAFNYQTLNKLTNLTFVGTQLKALNAQTFLGLETVENFQLFNVLKQETLPFSASNFLQPMATSLSNLVLQQTEESCCSNIIHDPTEWLGGNSGTVYSKLTYVDLSGTNFNDTLNDNTFAKFLAVQELRMTNCSLSTIAENAFTGILSTLKSLDLRYNHLQTLDGELLAAAIPIGINMELGWNMWRCDCDNMETIEYMKQIKNNSAADTVCATPTELQGTQIRFAQVTCDDTTTLTTIMTSSTSKGATTTIAKETTTTMVTTTDYTTSEPTGPFSQDTSTSSTNTITTSTLPISTAGITTTTVSGKTEQNTDSTIIISADTTTTTSPSTTSIMPTTLGDCAEVTTESNSKTSSTSSTTANDNSTFPTLSSGTSILPTTTGDGTVETTVSNSNSSSTSSTTASDNSAFPTSSSGISISQTTLGDSTEVTTESNSKTSSTSSTTASDNSTFPPSSSATSITPTTLGDCTEVTTESNSKTSSKSSTTESDNSTFPTSSSTTSITPTITGDGTVETTVPNSEIPSKSSTTPNFMSTSFSDTSKMPTTSDSIIIITTQSNSETPSKSSTTTNRNPILSTSSFATSIMPTTSDDRTEETTESNSKTSVTASATTINQSTLSTSSSTTIMIPATPDYSAEETTASTLSGAASIHRW
ncbi:uncharacterized protein LOC126757610 [Bactrocera neohumeralis]|uniref:uncharacterized protein LOC126757610 n=1 Tax=Bactrocera neohumeralis TaxID=98809 RepID=UPI0021669CDA|nr:uncharacterized protein LOC126757610 [Bactrocera neohumeralis]